MKLVLDLSDVSYMDTAGLGELVRGMKRARDVGGDLRLCGLRKEALRIFVLTELNEQMAVYPSRENAVASRG